MVGCFLLLPFLLCGGKSKVDYMPLVEANLVAPYVSSTGYLISCKSSGDIAVVNSTDSGIKLGYDTPNSSGVITVNKKVDVQDFDVVFTYKILKGTSTGKGMGFFINKPLEEQKATGSNFGFADTFSGIMVVVNLTDHGSITMGIKQGNTITYTSNMKMDKTVYLSPEIYKKTSRISIKKHNGKWIVGLENRDKKFTPVYEEEDKVESGVYEINISGLNKEGFSTFLIKNINVWRVFNITGGSTESRGIGKVGYLLLLCALVGIFYLIFIKR